MADVTILEISRVLTAPDLDDSMEVQSTALGSAQIPISALCGIMLANGLFTLNDATTTLWTIPYGSTLPAVPTKFRFFFNGLSVGGGGSGNILAGNWVSDTVSDTQFQLQLLGVTGDLTHTVYWEALA